MRTKYIEIYERNRLLGASDSERYALRVRVHGTLKQVEKIREAIFKLIQESS